MEAIDGDFEWKIHISVQQIVNPEDIHPAEVEVWFFTLHVYVTKYEFHRFCGPLGHAMCHFETSAALRTLLFVSAPCDYFLRTCRICDAGNRNFMSS